MKIRTHTALIATMIFMQIPLSAQLSSVKEVLDKVTQFYKGEDSYRIEMTFSMMRGITGNTITESYKGTMEKNGSYGRNLFLETEIHRFPNAQLAIDTKNRVVTLSDLGPEQNSPAEVASLLDYYTKSQLIDGGSGEWVCELVSEGNGFSQLPYGKIEVYVDKENFSVAKQVLYFSNLVPFADGESGSTVQDYGRLVIEMEHELNADIAIRRLKDFIAEKADQDRKLIGQYMNFQLIDKTK